MDAEGIRWDVTRQQSLTAGEGVPARLRWANLAVGVVHLAQAVAIVALSNSFALPVTASFLAGPPGSDLTARETLWEVPVGPAVALFLLLAAVDHLLMAAPGVWPWYRDNLRRGINQARWWEYALSASVMVVLIAQITGVSDVGALVAIFGANAAMIFFGLDGSRLDVCRARPAAIAAKREWARGTMSAFA